MSIALDHRPPTAPPPTSTRAAEVKPEGLAAPEDTIRRRTGRGWQEWFDPLDAWGPTCVTATFEARGEAKSTVVLEHGRIEESDQAEALRTLWRERLTEHKAQLEAGTRDA